MRSFFALRASVAGRGLQLGEVAGGGQRFDRVVVVGCSLGPRP